jgi:hypothetical protein
VVSVRARLTVPVGQYHEVVGALAGVLGELAVRWGGTVGWLGLVPREAPLLVALAPQRDAVARRAASVLTEGYSHRVPSLWLFLPPGMYLGQAVEPDSPLDPNLRALAELVTLGRARAALLVVVTPELGQCRVTLTLVSELPRLRACLKLAHHELAPIGDWLKVM